MPYILPKPESYDGKSFLNQKGNAECVEFLRQALHLPPTALWLEGKKVTKGDLTIASGTAIATFVGGKYPQTGASGMHAAVYLDQNEVGLVVLDQWRAQGKVLKRTIKFKPSSASLSNDGNAFSVVETAAVVAQASAARKPVV